MRHGIARHAFVGCLGLAMVARPLASQDAPFIAAATDGGVTLRWAWGQGERPRGYHVERREVGAGAWSRLTRSPVARVRDRERARVLLGSAFDRHEAMLFPASAADELRDPETFRSLLLLAADVEPPVADVLGVRWVDASALADATYEYRLVALVREGERIVGTTGPVRGAPAARADPPGSLAAGQGPHGVGLRWEHGRTFTAYNVWRRRGGTPAERINDGPVLVFSSGSGSAPESSPVHFRDTLVAAGDTLRYSVEGIDAFGRTSLRSHEAIVVMRDLEPPAPPPLVAAVVRGDTVVVSWQPSPSSDVARYRMWWSLSRDGGWAEAATQAANAPREVRELGRPERTLLWYRLTAVDRAGNESAASFAAMVEIPDLRPPPAPDSVAGAVVDRVAQLRWPRSRAGDVRGYRVWRSSQPGAEPALLTALPVPDTAFSDTLRRAADHAFHYLVAAVDSSFNEGARAGPVVLRPPDVTPPSAPRVVEARAGEERLLVRWLPNPERDLVGYALRWRVRGEREWRHVADSIPAGVTAFTLVGVPPRETIEIVALAIDDAGLRSAPSVPVAGVAHRRAAPRAVEIRRVARTDDLLGVLVEWDARGVPVDTAARLVVLRRDPGTRAPRAVGAALPSSGRFLDVGARREVAYEYSLRVVDAHGNIAQSRRARRVAATERSR